MIVTAVKYADIRGRSAQWVSNQIAAGMPAVGSGRSGSPYKIDTEVAMDWEVTQAKHSADTENGSDNQRFLKERADKLALENAERRGLLVRSATVLQVMTGLAADISGRLEALPGRVASEFAGITDAGTIRSRLLDECRGIRRGAADYLGRLPQCQAELSGGAVDTASGAPKERVRVGRRKARAATRKRRARAVSK